MAFMDQLERRFGRFAIPGLIRIVVGFNALVFVLLQFNPWFLAMIDLQPAAIMQGEVWRVFTYIFIPPFTSVETVFQALFFIIALRFLWFLGTGVEADFGAFRFNLFYLMGMFCCTLAAFISGPQYMNILLNTTILFAFATLFPNYQILLFFVLPVQMKWIAWVSAAFLGLQLIIGPWPMKMAIIASLGNYFLFFGPRFVAELRSTAETRERRSKFDAGKRPDDEPLHVCSECKRTDIGNPDLDFRVAADGTDICTECLKNNPQAS